MLGGISIDRSVQFEGNTTQRVKMNNRESFTIHQVCAEAKKDLRDTIALFYEYAGSLGFDLAFQNFDQEMAKMPGKYAPPTGELLLARNGSGEPIGCVGLRPLTGKCCEMKRLYVKSSARGTGLGKALAIAIIDAAERLGYREIRLDTLPRMAAAQKMYRQFGFVDIPAYYETPLEGTNFLSLSLPRPG